MLRSPYATVDDFVFEGFGQEYEGVYVYHGKVMTPAWAAIPTPGKLNAPHWWDEVPILITDSDPQYFCINISFPNGE